MSDKIENLTYTQAITELENIVAKMQSPDCDIDSLADLTKRGIALMQHCKRKLHSTDEAITEALSSLSD